MQLDLQVCILFSQRKEHILINKHKCSSMCFYFVAVHAVVLCLTGTKNQVVACDIEARL